MVRSFLGPLLTRRPSPTVDLYFLNSCGDLVGAHGPIQRVTPTVFESDRVRLVLRHDVGAPPAISKPVVYFVDDAIFSGLRDRTLPVSHRAKLRATDCAAACRLAPGAKAIVASTEEVIADLRAALPGACGAPVHVVDPYWRESPPALDHFDAPGPLSLAFLGAGTHRSGARFARAVFDIIRAEFPDIVLFLSANHRGAFDGVRPGLRHVEPTAWPDYRAYLAEARRHLALYPVPDTAHARARSANKLVEHALVGAAPLYSEIWPRGRIAAAAGAGLALPHDPRAWAAAARGLIRDRAAAKALAAGAQALARRLTAPEAQRALWRALLEVDG
jgi:hypothetical protein